jgi:hypothetical protein
MLVLTDTKIWDAAGDDSDEDAKLLGTIGAQHHPGSRHRGGEGLHNAGEMPADDMGRAGRRTAGLGQMVASLHPATEHTYLKSSDVRHNEDNNK